MLPECSKLGLTAYNQNQHYHSTLFNPNPFCGSSSLLSLVPYFSYSLLEIFSLSVIRAVSFQNVYIMTVVIIRASVQLKAWFLPNLGLLHSAFRTKEGLVASLVPLPSSSFPLLPFLCVVLAPAKCRKDRGRKVILSGHSGNLALSSSARGTLSPGAL